jgi:hypothetical protein
MISSETHTKKWLENTGSLFKGKYPILIERVIKALTLLEQLKLQGVDFIFKGGRNVWGQVTYFLLNFPLFHGRCFDLSFSSLPGL